jgi:hypothetical protein
MAARYQLSAFSDQPLNKHSQHAVDFGYFLRQLSLSLFDSVPSHCQAARHNSMFISRSRVR